MPARVDAAVQHYGNETRRILEQGLYGSTSLLPAFDPALGRLDRAVIELAAEYSLSVSYSGIYYANAGPGADIYAPEAAVEFQFAVANDSILGNPGVRNGYDQVNCVVGMACSGTFRAMAEIDVLIDVTDPDDLMEFLSPVFLDFGLSDELFTSRPFVNNAPSTGLDFSNFLEESFEDFRVNYYFTPVPAAAPIPLPAGFPLLAVGLLALVGPALRRHR